MNCKSVHENQVKSSSLCRLDMENAYLVFGEYAFRFSVALLEDVVEA